MLTFIFRFGLFYSLYRKDFAYGKIQLNGRRTHPVYTFGLHFLIDNTIEWNLRERIITISEIVIREELIVKLILSPYFKALISSTLLLIY